MNAGERRLAGLAAALIGEVGACSPAEHRLLAAAEPVSPQVIADARMRIAAGHDPLGAKFCLLRSPVARRGLGATYTPPEIVAVMMNWAAGELPGPVRIIDPGSGSGRFLMAAAACFPTAGLIGVDLDPLAMLMLRANAAVLGFADRLRVVLGDYRSLALPSVQGPTLFIGNPPYVRHHDIDETWKAWLAKTAERFGLTASKLAGLHIHFFLKTRELAQPGDFGAFITAAEWLDVNYGQLLRTMLADGLGGTAVHIIDPKAQPFADTLATGAITCFRVGNRSDRLIMRAVDSLSRLAPLAEGRSVRWGELASAPKWSHFARETRAPMGGSLELGELFRVHRGAVTGCNRVWVASPDAPPLPRRFKVPTVTAARDLLLAGPAIESVAGLKTVVDLPTTLDGLAPEEHRAVQRFLRWARTHGADKGYIATHRRAWWAVELRAPAPILCTYMARRAPAFVRNTAGARHINIAHGLYPRQPLSEMQLTAVLGLLRRHVDVSAGRTYAGGLVKFEPKELERIRLPALPD